MPTGAIPTFPILPKLIDEAVGPGRGKLFCRAQFAPEFAERFDVGNGVRYICLPQPFKPLGTFAPFRRRLGNHSYQFLDGLVHRCADRARGAVHMLQRGRYSLKEQHRTFGGENWICAADLSDLRRRLLHALNRSWSASRKRCA